MGNEGSTQGGGGKKHVSTGLEHSGHIDCHCLHHTDETVEEARTGGRIHLNTACFWSCCGARWDDFDCQRNLPKNRHEHTGHIDCHCLHHANESVQEARNAGRVHLNSACFWSCCHARWDDFVCKNSTGGDNDSDTSGDSDSDAPSSSHEHTGHIDCHCLHHTDETVEEARTGGRIHLNGSCFWSCCHANWDDFTCKNGGGAPRSSSHEHTGHIDCHCLHHANESVQEARTAGRIHLNSACFWSCCHARWDDFDCKNASGGSDDEGSTPGGQEHHGFIVCKCGHKRKEVWAEAKTHDLVHRNGACRWSCCGENWDNPVCSGGGPRIDISQHQHSGHIKCRCAHKKNDDVQSLASSHRIHLNVRCFWSCCGARWDDPICESRLPSSLRDGSGGSDAQPEPKRKRKHGSDYNRNIHFTDDYEKSSSMDVDY